MRNLIALPLLAVAAGCAAYGGSSLRPGAPEAEVRGLMGAPAVELPNPDGSKRLAYPRGPLGTQTFMADVGRDGALQGVTAVLNDDTFNRIRPGLSRDDVLRTIGPPGETMHFPRTNQDSWDYRYHDTWGYLAVFSVNFDSGGTVVSTFKRRIERDRGGR